MVRYGKWAPGEGADLPSVSSAAFGKVSLSIGLTEAEVIG